ncbi:MAG TPA: ABC transporter ATP-binding protein [Acidimicrobiales bacterium]
MTTTIVLDGATLRYHSHVALDGVNVTVDGPSITGLLGRNGAGKTTLLRLISGHELPSAGQVRVLGVNPAEDAHQVLLVREDQAFPDLKVRDALRAASFFHLNWSHKLADTLLGEFDLPPDRRIKHLSRGMRSALGIVLGLAAQAPVTLFDEPYAGLDATARRLFYDRILADYTEHPRTFVLSTHLIDEAADLLERVLVIDGGRIVLDAPADELRGSATAISGSVPAVAEFIAGRTTWERRTVGTLATATIADMLDATDQARARQLHLAVAPLSLQEIVVHATHGQTGRCEPLEDVCP